MKVLILPDIHGKLSLLIQVIETYPDHKYVFLGDLIDRGSESAEVLALVQTLYEQGRVLAICRGNHEDMAYEGLLDGDRDAFDCWIENGGVTTLMSYSDIGMAALREDLEWLRVNSVPFYRLKREGALDIMCVHASNPSAELLAGENEDATWWRRDHLWTFQPEIGTPLPEGCGVSVHGHRIQKFAQFDGAQRAVYLDLGSFMTGRYAVLDADTTIFTKEWEMEIVEITATKALAV